METLIAPTLSALLISFMPNWRTPLQLAVKVPENPSCMKEQDGLELEEEEPPPVLNAHVVLSPMPG